MQWRIDDQVDEWCVQPLVPSASVPVTDFGGLWWAGSNDNGWGMSIENFGNGGILVLLYVYADDGSAVWYLGQSNSAFVPGQPLTLEMRQRTGFSRLDQNGSTSDAVAGTMTITLANPSDSFGAGNSVVIDVNYQGAEGGTWQRDTPIARLTQPRP
jgi:hypothetical protein